MQTLHRTPLSHIANRSSRRSFPTAALLLSLALVALCSQIRAQQPLIVVGFMGGNVRSTNFVHREALLARDLQQHNPLAVHAEVFANHNWKTALKIVMDRLDTNKDGHLSATEKSAARIVIYGHSWGASETVALARRLNKLNIPVLLTVQVDSVEKMDENDGDIPPNVREAINFYQTEGLLHGRPLIEATDPRRTTILGNYKSTYKKTPVSCPGYPWFARAFMKSHIEIENDPAVWNRIEALIQTKVLPAEAPQLAEGPHVISRVTPVAAAVRPLP
jgi:hypothetical protein